MPVANITDVRRRIAQGKGAYIPLITLGNGSLTTATATSGHFTNSLNVNSIGSTYPTTLTGFDALFNESSVLAAQLLGSSSAIEHGMFGIFYQIGTFSISGASFTHSGTFTRLRRTVFGQANTAIPYIPVYYVTTAVSGASSAPTFTFTYVDQDGNTGETSITNTLPATAVNAQSCYNMMPKTSDSAVLDITAMSITANGASAGACTIYGFEPLATQITYATTELCNHDTIYGGLKLPDLQPASPDSGSVTSFLGWLYPSNNATANNMSILVGVSNT